jgi:hypothetical protein
VRIPLVSGRSFSEEEFTRATLEDNLADYLGHRRLLLKTLGRLSALALSLAAVGLYG